jgi:hypothetical protein
MKNFYEPARKRDFNNEVDVVTNKTRKITELSDDEMQAIYKKWAFKILENFQSNAFSLELEKSSQMILNFIDCLSKNLEHWKVPGNLLPIYFYINFWLKGKQPPPRCQALINEFLCVEEAAKNSFYCQLLHDCRSTSCKNQRISAGITFCNEHICQFQDCKFERYKEIKYCLKHICSACVLTNSKEIKSRNPFACDDHKCKLDNCNKLQVYPYLGLCIEHVCIECATGNKTKIHLRCINNTKLCLMHKCCITDCNNKRLNYAIEFCVYHICRLCSFSGVLTGADPKCPQSQLCENHRCSYSKACNDPKRGSSIYCANHSCKECVSLNCSTINAAMEKAPRNSCKSHPLCQFVRKNGSIFYYLF